MPKFGGHRTTVLDPILGSSWRTKIAPWIPVESRGYFGYTLNRKFTTSPSAMT